MPRRRKIQGPQFICDRTGLQFPMSEAVVEPGTGFLVHFLESDGQYSLVNHPQSKPITFKEDMKPLPNASKENSQADEATILVTETSPTDYIVDDQFLPIYYD